MEDLIDSGLMDDEVTIENARAKEMADRLCAEEGLFCGMSSGANVCAAIDMAKTMDKGSTIVTVVVGPSRSLLCGVPQRALCRLTSRDSRPSPKLQPTLVTLDSSIRRQKGRSVTESDPTSTCDGTFTARLSSSAVAAMRRWLCALWVLALLAAACSPDGDDALPPVDPIDDRVRSLEAALDAANSRWLAGVATSASYSPAISRLLAVDALRRSETPEAWSALGRLLFADHRRPAETIDVPHGAAVNVVRFSADGELLATGAGDGAIRLFVPGTTEPVATMSHDDAIAAIVFAAEAPLLATASRDGRAIVWDLEGRELRTVNHADQVNDVAITADGSTTATASHDGVARITTASETVDLTHRGPVWSVDVTADGAFVATGSATEEGGITTLWSGDGLRLASFEHDDAAIAVRFSPDGAYLFAASAGTTGHLIDVESATSVAMPSAGRGVSGVQWRPDGIEVATYSLGAVFRVRSPDGVSLGRLDQAGGERGIAYDTTGQWAVVGSGNFAFSFGSVGVWDLATETNLIEINTAGPVQSVAVSPDGTWVAAGFRFADGAAVDGGLVQFVGRDKWVERACEGHDGIINAARWAELVGPDEPFIPGCPGVEAPPLVPEVSTP